MIERNILKKFFIKNTNEKQCLEENYICPSYINNENPKYLEIDTLNNISMYDKNDNKDYIDIMNRNMDNLKEELY